MDLPAPGHHSVIRTLADGRKRSFPSRDDYIQALVDDGRITGLADLRENKPEWIPRIQRHWLRRNQTGCRFAAKLAAAPDSESWIDEVLLDPANLQAIDSVNRSLDAFAGAAEAFQLILPTVDSPADLCDFLGRLLSQCPRWFMVEVPWPDGESRDDVQIGLRWRLPADEAVSWVLGFAPLDSMPFTRRAPFSSIIWRSGGPGRCPDIMGHGRPEDDASGLPSVHLADLPDGLRNESAVEKFWNGTQVNKSDILHDDGLAISARARVTFVLPGAHRNRLAPLLQDQN